MHKELFNRSKKVTPGGVHSPVRSFAGIDHAPVFFESASGPYLFDIDDQKYLDFCSSFGPMILGHRDPDVQEAVNQITAKAWSFGACEKYSLKLAEWITNEIPWLDQIRFVNSGTEAVMTALRLAKGHTGRDYILKFDGCYHGHVDSMLVKSGSGLAGLAESSSAGVSAAIASETLVAPLDHEKAVEDIFNEYGDKIAAIIVEPLPANYGLLKQRKEFLGFLRKISSKYNSLLIFDEVISGFRTSMSGMAGVADIVPDLVTYGKIIGGGFPVGAFGGKKEIMDDLAPHGRVYQAGTLSGNPVCMSAGLATLKKIKSQNVLEKINNECEQFANGLNQAFENHGIDMQCHHMASLFWMTKKLDTPLRTVAQIPENQKESYNRIYPFWLKEGIYLAPAAFEVGFYSYAITKELQEIGIEKIVNGIIKAHE